MEQEGKSLGCRPRYSAKGSAIGFAAAVRLKARMAIMLVEESFMVGRWTEDDFGEFGGRGLGFGVVGSVSKFWNDCGFADAEAIDRELFIGELGVTYSSRYRS